MGDLPLLTGEYQPLPGQQECLRCATGTYQDGFSLTLGVKFGVPIWDPWEYLFIATNDIPCIKQNYETPKIPLLMVRMLETLDGFLMNWQLELLPGDLLRIASFPSFSEKICGSPCESMNGWRIGRPPNVFVTGSPTQSGGWGSPIWKGQENSPTFRYFWKLHKLSTSTYKLDCSPHDSKWQVRLSLHTLSQVLIFPAGHEHSGCWPVQMDLSLLALT